jgi:hemerythrin-like domain-containing protein
MAHEFIEHLKEDHKTQRRLGKKLRKAQDPGERSRLRQEFYDELLPHVVGEEASIFRYLSSTEGEAREEALKALQEHHVAKVVLRELMALSVEGDIFNPKGYVLDEMNRHHMDEEEKTHFPMLEKMASREELDALFADYKKAEAEVEGQ